MHHEIHKDENIRSVRSDDKTVTFLKIITEKSTNTKFPLLLSNILGLPGTLLLLCFYWHLTEELASPIRNVCIAEVDENMLLLSPPFFLFPGNSVKICLRFGF